LKVNEKAAARLFLARAVSEELPFINGFSGVNCDTEQPDERLLFAWENLWLDIWHKYGECRGTIKSTDDNAETLARAFLDRYGRIYPRNGSQTSTLKDDAKKLTCLFRSAKSLLLSVRKVVGAWAEIKNLASLDSQDWPPWSEESALKKR